MNSTEWVKIWLKTCDENGIPPWKFDFKQFYKSEIFPSANSNDTSHLESWLKYKYTKELNKAKSNPFTDSLKKIYEDENIEKGMDKDTDKVVFPIYQVLEWQDEEKSVIKGDHMNSFLTTFTPLLLTGPTKKIPYAPFGNENKKTFNEEPKIANKLSGWAEEADSGLLNITKFEFYKEQYKIWGNFNLFARMTDTLGNFTVIPSKLNIARGSSEAFRDYWDITLRQVLRLIDLSVSKENQLYLLGDYVDGGKDSYRILKQIMKLEQKYPEQIKVLWGNHDEAFMNWLEQKDNDLFGYLSSGGVLTIKSFFRDNPEEYNIIVKNADGKSKRAMVQDLIAAIKSVGNKTGLIKWLHKKDAASRFIETDNQIFVHAGIAEYPDGLWKYATADEEFTNMYPPKTGSFYKDIIAGHVWNTEVSKDLSYAGKVYWDGESHFFIDGNVLATKNIPVLEYDTETKKYFSFEKNTETDSLIKYEIK